MLLEIIAETVEDAREAEQGGAGRIELVRDLDRGGLTPPPLIEAVLKAVRIPVRVMVRESESFEAVAASSVAGCTPPRDTRWTPGRPVSSSDSSVTARRIWRPFERSWVP